MPSVADLVEPEALVTLATPANLHLGRQILEEGSVELTQLGPLRVEARVGGGALSGQRRTVTLVSAPDGLQWSCTCTRRKDLFCKHCAAAALLTWEKAPPRRIPRPARR